jgi:hypothetical protein
MFHPIHKTLKLQPHVLKFDVLTSPMKVTTVKANQEMIRAKSWKLFLGQTWILSFPS